MRSVELHACYITMGIDNEMKRQGFTHDLITVVLSNCVVLISSILAGFVIPNILGVTEFGYYKLFALYLGYASLVHFGFVDGILLKFAGIKLEDINKTKFRLYSIFFICIETAVCITVILVALLFLPSNLQYLFVLLGVDVLLVNVTTYYQYVAQSVMRFNELSIRKILLSSGKVLLVVILWIEKKHFLQTVNANIYVSGLVLIDAILTVWYLYTYRDITFGKRSAYSDCKDELKAFFKNGIIITISYQASNIIFSLDRQFVSVLYDTDTYGVYAFAYNLIAMVTTVVGAVSLVLFPRLRQLDKNGVVRTFSIGMSSISIVSFAALIGYQPLCFIIRHFLPDYVYSLNYLQIIFPGLALSTCISIIMFTYYKAIDAHKTYFKVCCIILLVAAVMNYLAYKIFGTPESISVASIVTLLIWYFSCEYYFIKVHNVKWKRDFVYIAFAMSGFYIFNALITSSLISWLIYIVFYSVLTILFYKNDIILLFNRYVRHR